MIWLLAFDVDSVEAREYCPNQIMHLCYCFLPMLILLITIQFFVFPSMYYTADDDYKYKISICQKNPLEDTAVQQFGKKWPENKPWVVVGRYKNAHVTGGSKYWD